MFFDSLYTYSYGNMVPYNISFSRVHSLDPNSEMVMLSASPWINSCEMLGEGVFMFVGGWMNERLGFHLTALIGSLLIAGGTAASFGSVYTTLLLVDCYYIWTMSWNGIYLIIYGTHDSGYAMVPK